MLVVSGELLATGEVAISLTKFRIYCQRLTERRHRLLEAAEGAECAAEIVPYKRLIGRQRKYLLVARRRRDQIAERPQAGGKPVMSNGEPGINLDCAAIAGMGFLEPFAVPEQVAKVRVQSRVVRLELQCTPKRRLCGFQASQAAQCIAEICYALREGLARSLRRARSLPMRQQNRLLHTARARDCYAPLRSWGSDRWRGGSWRRPRLDARRRAVRCRDWSKSRPSGATRRALCRSAGSRAPGADRSRRLPRADAARRDYQALW